MHGFRRAVEPGPGLSRRLRDVERGDLRSELDAIHGDRAAADLLVADLLQHHEHDDHVLFVDGHNRPHRFGDGRHALDSGQDQRARVYQRDAAHGHARAGTGLRVRKLDERGSL